MNILFLIIGLVIGAIALWFISSFKYKGESGRAEERSKLLEQRNIELQDKLNSEQQKVLDLNSKLFSHKSDSAILQECRRFLS